MTYDNWKSTEPEYEDTGHELLGTCDVCECQHVPVSRCWAFGIETLACDECRGIEPEEDDDEERARHEQPDPDLLRDQKRDDALWDKQNPLPPDDEPF